MCTSIIKDCIMDVKDKSDVKELYAYGIYYVQSYIRRKMTGHRYQTLMQFTNKLKQLLSYHIFKIDPDLGEILKIYIDEVIRRRDDRVYLQDLKFESKLVDDLNKYIPRLERQTNFYNRTKSVNNKIKQDYNISSRSSYFPKGLNPFTGIQKIRNMYTKLKNNKRIF